MGVEENREKRATFLDAFEEGIIIDVACGGFLVRVVLENLFTVYGFEN